MYIYFFEVIGTLADYWDKNSQVIIIMTYSS